MALTKKFIDKACEEFAEATNKEHLCDFMTWDKNGNSSSVGIGAPCHAPLNRVPGHPVLLITGLQNEHKGFTEKKGLAEEYTNWLVNESNWADNFIHNLDFKSILKGGFVLRTDITGNMMASACFATRYMWESSNHLDFWKVYKDKGLNPNVALLFATGTSSLEKSKFEGENRWSFQRGCITGHNVFAATGYSLELLRNVRDNNPAHQGDRIFRESPGYSGVTRLWGSVTKADVTSLLKDCCQEVTFGGLIAGNLNPWGKRNPERKVNVMNFDKLKKEVEKL